MFEFAMGALVGLAVGVALGLGIHHGRTTALFGDARTRRLLIDHYDMLSGRTRAQRAALAQKEAQRYA